MSPNGISSTPADLRCVQKSEVVGVAYHGEELPATVGEGAAATETGSSNGSVKQEGTAVKNGKEKDSTSLAVRPKAPDIPNVVEYHLRIKRQITNKLTAEQASTTSFANTQQTFVTKRRNVKDQRDVTLRLSQLVLSGNNNLADGFCELPQVFQVKYLGSHDARGLWGIRNIRQPIDNMVANAKSLSSRCGLPFMKLAISQDGVGLLVLGKRNSENSPAPGLTSKLFPIEAISYGVQDLVYTRVFCMIVVRETDNFRRKSPFECHGFVCESKFHARQMTYALAAAFQIYSEQVENQEVRQQNQKSFVLKDFQNPSEFQVNYPINGEFC